MVMSDDIGDAMGTSLNIKSKSLIYTPLFPTSDAFQEDFQSWPIASKTNFMHCLVLARFHGGDSG